VPLPAAPASRRLCLIGLAALGAAVAVVLAAVVAVQAGTPPRWMSVSAIILLAATVSSTVGFAFSAIAGAMILHYMPDGVEAVQTMMIASIGIQAYSVAGLWRSIQWSRCAPFIFGGVAALPLGIVLLLHLQPRAYALAIGAALVVYGVYMLLRRPRVLASGERRGTDLLVGALGGITGPLAALPGTWLTIWCGMRGWDKLTQRAVYQPYILVMQLIGLGALFLLKPQQGTLDGAQLAYALPGLAGAVIGLRFFRWMTDTQFQRAIYLALIGSGIALAVK
jgi:uncharacterized membrane protein YfcA